MRRDWVLVATFYEMRATTFLGCGRQGEPGCNNAVNLAQAPIGQLLMHSHNMFGLTFFD